MLKKAVALAAVVGVVGFTAAAVAGDRGKDFKTDMSGFEEVPAISTDAGASVKAEVNRAGTEIRYHLRYRNLEGNVTQSHIHLGQEGVNGGIVLFFCSNLGNGPAGTPACPASPGQVDGTLTADDVVTQTAQGIEGPAAFGEIVRAMRAGVTYANVHSSKFPGGEVRGQFDREHDDH